MYFAFTLGMTSETMPKGHLNAKEYVNGLFFCIFKFSGKIFKCKNIIAHFSFLREALSERISAFLRKSSGVSLLAISSESGKFAPKLLMRTVWGMTVSGSNYLFIWKFRISPLDSAYSIIPDKEEQLHIYFWMVKNYLEFASFWPCDIEILEKVEREYRFLY